MEEKVTQRIQKYGARVRLDRFKYCEGPFNYKIQKSSIFLTGSDSLWGMVTGGLDAIRSSMMHSC